MGSPESAYAGKPIVILTKKPFWVFRMAFLLEVRIISTVQITESWGDLQRLLNMDIFHMFYLFIILKIILFKVIEGGNSNKFALN